MPETNKFDKHDQSGNKRTSSRVNGLEQEIAGLMAATQATVSSENAQLFTRLQQKVAEQTAELRRSDEQLRRATSTLGDVYNERQQAESALRESGARYRSLFENMSSGVVVYEVKDEGQDFVFVGFNGAAERISNNKRENVLGKSVLELFPPIEEFGLVDVYRRVWQSGEPEYYPTMEFREGQFAGWIESYVYRLPSGELVAIFDDVTAHKLAEDELKQQKELLESTIEALDHPFCVIRTADSGIEIANSAARNLSEDGALTTCYALTHNLDKPCTGPDHICPLQQVVQTKKPVTLEHIHFDAQGEPYSVEVRGYPLFDRDGNVERMIEYTLDITDRKRAERISKEAAAAAERERLARDLHDAVSQNLFSAGLIAELLPELWEIDQIEARSSLVKLRQLIRATSAEMRTMLLELRPDSLTEAALDVLLDHLSETLTSRAGIPVVTELDKGCDVPLDVKIALYRIVQEAFNNIAKHAQAGKVNLTYRCDDERVEICVQDNGRGFDPGAIPPGHMGVGIMQARIAEVGGSLIVASEAGQGTRIVLKWQEQGAADE